MCPNSKTVNLSKLKKIRQRSKTPIMKKLKNTKSDTINNQKVTRLKHSESEERERETKLKNSNFDKTQKLKFERNLKCFLFLFLILFLNLARSFLVKTIQHLDYDKMFSKQPFAISQCFV